MILSIALVLGLIAVLGACGDDGPDAATGSMAGGQRIVEVEMVEFAYRPGSIRVDAGDTVTFVFHNRSDVVHEALLGDHSAQLDHDAEMASMPGMEHADDDDRLTIPPGRTAEITWTFGATGSTIVGCHQPGHWDAGMAMELVVA